MKEVRWLSWLITIDSRYFSAAHRFFDQFTVKPLFSQSMNLPWINSLSIINKCVMCWLVQSPVIFNFQQISVNYVKENRGQYFWTVFFFSHETCSRIMIFRLQTHLSHRISFWTIQLHNDSYELSAKIVMNWTFPSSPPPDNKEDRRSCILHPWRSY